MLAGSGNADAYNALKDLNFILNPEQEINAIATVLENIQTLEDYANVLKKKLEDKIQEKRYVLINHESKALKLEPDQAYQSRLEQDDNVKFSVAKELNILEDKFQSTEKTYKTLANQSTLLEELEQVIEKINNTKEAAIRNHLNNVETSKSSENANFETILESVTNLLTKLSVQNGLGEEYDQLSSVKEHLSSSEELQNDLNNLKKLHRASFSSKLYHNITGIEKMKMNENGVYGEFSDQYQFHFETNRYSDFFITSQLWNLL